MTAAITDFSQFTELRAGAGRNDPAALREVAGQFEALFLQSLLKNMRDASVGDPLFGDSDSLEMYQGLLDQQLSLEMASGSGIGIADMLVRQMSGDPASGGQAAYAFRPGVNIGPALPAPRQSPAPAIAGPLWDSPESFANAVWPHVQRAAERLDVAPEAILAQAALETGWGRHVPAGQGGESSLNLFGIKAGDAWNGASVVRQTLEFDDGVARRETARFRAYRDVGDSVDDYSRLLADNPRYAAVSKHGADVAGFAAALQASGYATDPAYADKISRVADSETMARVLTGLKNPPVEPK